MPTAQETHVNYHLVKINFKRKTKNSKMKHDLQKMKAADLPLNSNSPTLPHVVGRNRQIS